MLTLAIVLGCKEPTEAYGPVDFQVDVEDNPFNPFSAVVRVTADQDVVVHVEYGDVATPSTPLSADVPGEILVLGLRADEGYELVVEADDESAGAEGLFWETPKLPDDWPEVDVDATRGVDLDGVTCANTWTQAHDRFYMCIDRDGEPVWSLFHPDGVEMWAVHPMPGGGWVAVGNTETVLSFFDDRGELVADYPSIWFDGKTRFEHGWINMHETLVLTEGPWAGAVAFLTLTEEPAVSSRPYGSGIIVFDPATEEVLWDWTAHGELGDGEPIDPRLSYDRTGRHQDHSQDWMHGNALLHFIDPDGQEVFWMSMRAQDWIASIEVETDAIRWVLGPDGDFELTSGEWMYQQHAPEVQWHEGGQTRLLAFDNGVDRPDTNEPYSRIAELDVDEEAMTVAVRTVAGSSDPDDKHFFYGAGRGDADMMPDGDSVQLVVDNGAEPFVREVSYPDGETLWQWNVDVDNTYRVTYYPSLYETLWHMERDLSKP